MEGGQSYRRSVVESIRLGSTRNARNNHRHINIDGRPLPLHFKLGSRYKNFHDRYYKAAALKGSLSELFR